MNPNSEDPVLIALRAKKEERRKERNEPPPSVEAREKVFVQEMLKGALKNALAQLSPEDRKLAEAVYRHGDAGVQAIAKARGCDPGAFDEKLPIIFAELREILRAEI